jgi:outer membrane protein TolC
MYVAKPIDAEQSAVKLSQKSLDHPDFKGYLIKNGFSDRSPPFDAWDVESMYRTALFYHSDLAVAKEKLALAEYSIQVAGIKPALGIGGNIGRSDRANGDINPMSYSLQIDIPFETTSKRAIKVEQAQHLAEVSRLDAAEIAWHLRHQIQLDLINYHEQQRSLQLLQRELDTYQQLISMLEKRVAQGMGSNTELSQYQLMRQKSQIQLRNASAKTDYLIVKLSGDVGLSFAEFKRIPIAQTYATPLTASATSQSDTLQSEALIHRVDIRRSLARYAAAESKLKLEVAKQIPDISLSPGYAFEFGDRVWSLGLGTLLNLLQQQPTFIQEAEQLRAIEGAQFEALQASVIAQTNAIFAQYSVAQSTHQNAKEMLAAQSTHIQKIQKQFDAGLADRVALTQAQLTLHFAEQDVSATEFEMLRQYAQLENVIQRPLTEAVSMTQLNAR